MNVKIVNSTVAVVCCHGGSHGWRTRSGAEEARNSAEGDVGRHGEDCGGAQNAGKAQNQLICRPRTALAVAVPSDLLLRLLPDASLPVVPPACCMVPTGHGKNEAEFSGPGN